MVSPRLVRDSVSKYYVNNRVTISKIVLQLPYKCAHMNSHIYDHAAHVHTHTLTHTYT